MASHALEQLAHLEASQKLSIIHLSSSISDADDASWSESRTSDASTASDNANTTPANLAADLVHYKVSPLSCQFHYIKRLCLIRRQRQELFSKLRFSYLEQVTKEKFLRAVTAETPLFVEPADNAALETQLAAEKEALKAQKAEFARLTDEGQAKGRELAKRKHTRLLHRGLERTRDPANQR
jgi:hypothetical protein